MARIQFDTTPDLAPLLARAAAASLPRRGGRDGLHASIPPTVATQSGVTIDLDAVADYAHVCGFRLGSGVPPTWPHLLGFPLTMWLLTHDDFPFRALGLVHVRNHIAVHEALAIGDEVDLTVQLAGPWRHPRGATFDALVEVRRDDRLCWESTSTYLHRGPVPDGLPDPVPHEPHGRPGHGAVGLGDRAAAPGTPVQGGADAVDVDDLPMTAHWRVPPDIGRRYGAVSGDRNPIHMASATAKAFGFPRAIAHGMWTTAAAVAGLGTLTVPVTIDVVFRAPVLLPSTVEYATARTEDGWEFGLRGRNGRAHLAGVVRRQPRREGHTSP